MNIFLLILLILVFILVLWALFSGNSSAQKTPEDDLTLRRRASDRGENPLPEEIPGERRGSRSTDRKERESDESLQNIEVGEDFSLPHQPAGIIPLGSAYEVYRKTLSNAEAYIKKGEFETARSLYEGIHDRISDADIRQKIEENLDYLNNYHQVAARRLEEKRKQSKIGANEIRLTLEGSENLAGRIQEALNQPSGRLAQQEHLLESYRDELARLRNDMRMMERDRMSALQSNEEKYRYDSDEIQRLREELKSLREEQKNIKDEQPDLQPVHEVREEKPDPEIEKLNSELEMRERENDLLRERMSLMKQEIENLNREKETFSDVEKRLSEEFSSRMPEIHEELPQPVHDDNAILELKNEIAALRDSLSSLGTASEGFGEISKAVKDGIESLSPILKDAVEKRADDKAESPGNKTEEQKHEPVPETLKEPAKQEKKEEDKKNDTADKKDDFQLMEEIARGPQYDEPTDEDVMEKILSDAVREQAKKNARDRKKGEGGEEPQPDREKSPKKKKSAKEDSINDFELMSDFVKNDEESGPTDDEVMEKILRGAMKPQDMRGDVSSQDRGGQFKEPVRRKKELPILRVSYNFSRLPDEFTLSIDKNHLEYSFYKFKGLLEKANDYVKRRKVKDAINYYKVVMDQDIPQEFKDMLNQNIKDLNEYLTKYYTSG
jgi:hypothetical protein